MKMTHQSSPAEIELTCYYSVEQRGTISVSPLSNSIIIESLVPPELTVTPLVITESDSVTVNCQTPSSVPLSQCYFNFGKDKPAKPFSCQKTLTGTELLQITNQNSPAEVAVSCFYLKTHRAPNSNVFSISIRLPRPELTVTPLVITESHSVTVNCQTPSSVPVYQCWLYSVRDQTSRVVSCHQTLTGTELMKMTHQRSLMRNLLVIVTSFGAIVTELGLVLFCARRNDKNWGHMCHGTAEKGPTCAAQRTQTGSSA
ncbi:uncharacterized protein LOC129604136 [Betta splendens]|uniref:Uncharacterized protein LOC129604136 n=1 Tax=Betta splendens TaxID=158456 RepID=A0A9W2XTJ7_BETSP|nr:uncharacterized protein LOC129604136 [Betta splendens]